MIILIKNMTHLACVDCVKYINLKVSMDVTSVHQGYIVLDKNTDPEKIKQWALLLIPSGMAMSYVVRDQFIEKIVIEICNIFKYSELDKLELNLEQGQKFSLERYLPTVLKFDYDIIRNAFTQGMKISPLRFYHQLRWEKILFWFDLGKNVTEVSELALFQNPQSLSTLFMCNTGISPTDYMIARKRVMKNLQIPYVQIQNN